MPTPQADKARGRKKALDEEERLQRRRDRGDLAIIIASLLAVLGIMAGAGLFAWSVSTDNVQVASTIPQSGTPAY